MMTKSEKRELEYWKETAKVESDGFSKLSNWLRDNHPSIMKQYDDCILADIINTEGEPAQTS